MNNITIKITTDFTPYTGGRSRSTSDGSAEEFYEDLLRPKFIESEGTKLIIDLDGGPGYAGSFLDEAFGRLAHEFGITAVDRLEFITEEEPYLREEIIESMKEWSDNGIHHNSSLNDKNA